MLITEQRKNYTPPPKKTIATQQEKHDSTH